MGKYPPSELHNKYSDFHWKLGQLDPRFKRLYCADIDRAWLEYDYDKKAVVAVTDMKWKSDLYYEEMGLTSTEMGIYSWFERMGARVFIVYISHDFDEFIIRPFSESNLYKVKGAVPYGEWLLSLREGINFLDKFPHIDCKLFIKTYKAKSVRPVYERSKDKT